MSPLHQHCDKVQYQITWTRLVESIEAAEAEVVGCEGKDFEKRNVLSWARRLGHETARILFEFTASWCSAMEASSRP